MRAIRQLLEAGDAVVGADGLLGEISAARVAGSLIAGAPTGMVTEVRPPKVSTWSLAVSIVPGLAPGRARWAAPITKAADPISLVRRIRMAWPPSDRRITCRIVWLLISGPLGKAGSAPQDPTQCGRFGMSWLSAGGAVARIAVRRAEADALQTRSRAIITVQAPGCSAATRSARQPAADAPPTWAGDRG